MTAMKHFQSESCWNKLLLFELVLILNLSWFGICRAENTSRHGLFKAFKGKNKEIKCNEPKINNHKTNQKLTIIKTAFLFVEI